MTLIRSLLTRLRAYTKTLPLLVPISTPLDLFATFSNYPEDFIEPGSVAWEDVIDPMFNRVIRFRLMTVQGSATMIVIQIAGCIARVVRVVIYSRK